jgi:hypothetical protein
MTAARFGQALSDSDGLIKKLISINAWPIPSYFTALKSYLPEGKHCALLMIAESCLEPLQDLVREYSGTITYQKSAKEASKGSALCEFTWNHTTLHARSVDPNLTYLQSLFPADKNLTLVEHMYHHFGDEVIMHLEFIRRGGQVAPAALQVVRYTSEERLNEIIHYHEENGAFIANPHTYILEDGGMKTVDVEQLKFKEIVDPYGLLNPGKMKAWLERLIAPTRYCCRRWCGGVGQSLYSTVATVGEPNRNVSAVSVPMISHNIDVVAISASGCTSQIVGIRTLTSSVWGVCV